MPMGLQRELQMQRRQPQMGWALGQRLKQHQLRLGWRMGQHCFHLGLGQRQHQQIATQMGLELVQSRLGLREPQGAQEQRALG